MTVCTRISAEAFPLDIIVSTTSSTARGLHRGLDAEVLGDGPPGSPRALSPGHRREHHQDLDAVDLAELYRDDRQRNPVTAARGSTRHAAGPAPGGAHQLLDDGEHRDLGRGLDARPYRYGKGNRGNGSGAGEREERTAWKAAKAANP